MKELSTEIEFDGTPDEVWEVLTDFAAYPAWNPFLPRIEGELRPGARLSVRFQPVDERGMTIKPTVRAVGRVASCGGWGTSWCRASSTGSIDSGSKTQARAGSGSSRASASAVCSCH